MSGSGVGTPEYARILHRRLKRRETHGSLTTLLIHRYEMGARAMAPITLVRAGTP